MSGRRGDSTQWDRYWAYGNIHSFSQVAGGNYSGVLAGFWRVRLEALETDSHILDLATGNGAIALLALNAGDSLGRRFDVHGVDLADIEPAARVSDPALAESLRRIHFRGGIPAEELPYQQHTFDLVCSQFGIEYSDLGRAIPELARVLAPGGRFAAIVHHRDSILLRATHRELAQLGFVLDETRLYLKARNVLRAMYQENFDGRGKASPGLGKKQRGLRDAMRRIGEAAGASRESTMLRGPARYVEEIFSALGQKSPRELLAWLEEARQRVEANRQRLRDMLAAARDESGMAEMRERLADSGLARIETEVVRQDDGGVLGWCVDARGSDAKDSA